MVRPFQTAVPRNLPGNRPRKLRRRLSAGERKIRRNGQTMHREGSQRSQPGGALSKAECRLRPYMSRAQRGVNPAEPSLSRAERQANGSCHHSLRGGGDFGLALGRSAFFLRHQQCMLLDFKCEGQHTFKS